MLLWVILISIYSVFLQCTSSLGFLAASCRLRAGGQWIHGSMREGKTPSCSQGSPLQTCWVLTISSTLVSCEQHLFKVHSSFTPRNPRMLNPKNISRNILFQPLVLCVWNLSFRMLFHDLIRLICQSLPYSLWRKNL